MLPGFLARAVEVLLGRGRSLHLRAAGVATAVLAAVTLVGAYGVVAAERGAAGAQLTTYPRALWWAAETATTVGYGDFYPVTLWGRLVAVAVMLVGITAYGVVTAALATWFVGRDQERRHRAVRRAEAAVARDYAETARALHERFDRLEELLGSGSGSGSGSGGGSGGGGGGGGRGR